MVYLSDRALEGLKEYKYKPGGYTILDVIHNPFWEWLTSRMPMWLAPNLITLIGLIGIMLSYLASALYFPDFTGDESAPRWLHLLNALAIVVYVNLDCIDGKQARRTRSSSPLGQLFDHGCDALSVHLLVSNAQVALASPCGPASAILSSLVMMTWLLAHLEEYHTGQLMYSNGWLGVLEANYSLALLSFSSFLFGEQMWNTPLSSIAPFLPGDLLDGYVLRHVFFLASYMGCAALMCPQTIRILAGPTPSPLLSNAERGNKDIAWGSRIQQLLSLVGLLVLGAWWMAEDRKQLALGQCRMASNTFGISYSLVASQLIMTHMAKEPFYPFPWAYLFVGMGALNSTLHIVNGWLCAAVLCAVTVAAYLHYVSTVVVQVCQHLNISCFVIKPYHQASS
uniref:Ethanolaminephosphotransferase n=1 Tax=Dunaliella tertiolecta TaxID=3047 RepID=A0A7S3QKN7_DUNTE|mmetsp:Transcript_287/g.665  ORF Transcript_287/g.665 Transcript_287/m.665 type:complete len:396 (+) Transcript_287:87-1274(+)|eukprot:CAMPEP_0202348044 /NCGR_PEP_ID=MMETSP1126-20121109/6144_1 /ASSEMBLY_ACC=CAM_ASM_000457 /TAXON_ID=3047 /ORGANISM="Dunaliella tertiolecta, Strain CCMP1320" /LENGTH=395 /DNA_ID=CAMNT_0048939677 /DNA_START=87 /DNA_END=1274 /DNA_ORIENTATION=+